LSGPEKRGAYTSTKKSYDSIYITLQLIDENSNKIKFPSILLDNLRKTARGDSAGVSRFTIPVNWNVRYLTVIKRIEDYYPIKIPLMSNYNYYEIMAIVPKIDSTSSFYVDESSTKYKITSSQRPTFLEITKVTDSNSILISILKKAINKQPLLKRQIEYLINKLQE
jgi:hypothetical protein